MAIICLLLSCGKDDDTPILDPGGSEFGKITSAIVIVNPIVNQGSTTTLESGTQREGVSITAGSLDPVATDATGLAVVKNLPIGTGDDLIAAVSTDNAIVFMEPGTYEGDLIINAQGVLLFGSWDEVDGSASIINGTLKVNGGNVRMRGVTINSLTTVSANGFSAAFCAFNDATISGNSVSLLRNIFNGTNVSVPSSSAVLLDNVGIP